MSVTGRVLVTGGSSLLGAGVARALLERGTAVRCLQRGPSPPSVVAGGAQTVRGDVRDPAVVARATDGCTAVVHVAAAVGVSGPPTTYREVNVGGTANVIAAARGSRIARLVHISTPSVAHTGDPLVGAAAEPPALEGHDAAYSATKADAERLALTAADERLGVVAVRPHLIWGPGDTQLVGRIVERARGGTLTVVGGGTALVDTTYIDNAVSAVVAALDHVEPLARCSERAYVIANFEPRPVGELLLEICAAAGIEATSRSVPLSIAAPLGGLVERVYARRRPNDEPPLTRFLAQQLGTAHWFDPRPARTDLDWTPHVAIDEGLDRLRTWFAHGGFASGDRRAAALDRRGSRRRRSGSVPTVTSAVRFAVLGAHEPDRGVARHDDGTGPDERLVDALDLVVELADGRRVVLGLRAGAYVDEHGGRPERWEGGYVPLPVTRDLSAVRHFDFKQVFWLGPEEHACLVWTNADGLALRAVEHLLGDRTGSRLLHGPDGAGLPSPDDLGLDVPASLTWHPVGGDAAARSTVPDALRR